MPKIIKLPEKGQDTHKQAICCVIVCQESGCFLIRTGVGHGCSLAALSCAVLSFLLLRGI